MIADEIPLPYVYNFYFSTKLLTPFRLCEFVWVCLPNEIFFAFISSGWRKNEKPNTFPL
jgi:hypothetical protein